MPRNHMLALVALFLFGLFGCIPSSFQDSLEKEIVPLENCFIVHPYVQIETPPSFTRRLEKCITRGKLAGFRDNSPLIGSELVLMLTSNHFQTMFARYQPHEGTLELQIPISLRKKRDGYAVIRLIEADRNWLSAQFHSGKRIPTN